MILCLENEFVGLSLQEFTDKDLSCILCGSAPNRKSMKGCALLTERPEVVSYLSEQLGDSLNLDVYSKLICEACLRFVLIIQKIELVSVHHFRKLGEFIESP